MDIRLSIYDPEPILGGVVFESDGLRVSLHIGDLVTVFGDGALLRRIAEKCVALALEYDDAVAAQPGPELLAAKAESEAAEGKQ